MQVLIGDVCLSHRLRQVVAMSVLDLSFGSRLLSTTPGKMKKAGPGQGCGYGEEGAACAPTLPNGLLCLQSSPMQGREG